MDAENHKITVPAVQSSTVTTGNVALVSNLLERFGFPTVVSGVLLAAMMGWLPNPQLDTLNAIKASIQYQTAVTRAICYHLAVRDGTSYIGCEPNVQSKP